MKKNIRDIMAALAAILLYISGSVGKAKKNIGRGDILPIHFHNPEKIFFYNVINWLKDNDFSLISTRELFDIIKRREAFQKKAAWITFDDGWRRNLENVIPTVVEYDVPVTFFISTYPVENSGFFWWSVINRYKKELVLRYGIQRSEIWRLSWSEIKNIVNELKTNGSIMQREAMTVSEVIEISKLPQVTIGSHTVHHPIIKHCSETELISEILDSKLTLEKWIKKPVKYFSYPKGIYSQREILVLKKNGYDLAASTDNQLVSKENDLYNIPRFTVIDDAYFCEAICHVLGIWKPFINKFFPSTRKNYADVVIPK